MAVKKTASATKGKGAAAPKKAAGAKSAKKAAPKASAAKAAPKAKKAAAPKAKAAPAAKAKAAAPKKKAAPKLTAGQTELLKKVGGAGEAGYLGDKKAEARSLEALLGRKLLKRGAKDKASGAYRYTVSAVGKKHLDAPAPAPAPAPGAPAGGA